MNKIMDMLDKKLTHKIVFFISIYLVFVSSDETLPSVIYYELTDFLFLNEISDNSILFNVSSGVLVSYIFYFLIVYLPRVRDENNLRPFIEKRVNRISLAVEGILKDLSLVSGVQLDYDDLDEAKLNDVLQVAHSHCTHVEFKISKLVLDEKGQLAKNHDGTQIFEEYDELLSLRLLCKWRLIKSSKMDLMSIHSILPTDVIKNLDLIDDVGFEFIFELRSFPSCYGIGNIISLYRLDKALKQWVVGRVQ